jgi:RNA polymerase sigma-70 factor (ECF subfamily)
MRLNINFLPDLPGYNIQAMADRSNEQWVSDLKSAGVRQEVALADLREVIKTGLPYALSKYLSSNDPRYDALVEEAAQETLVQVLARIDTFEGRSKFTTWVHTIAVRIALTELRRARWRDVYLEEMTEIKHVQFDTMELPEPEALPEDQVERSDMLVQVRRLIMEELTDRQRQAMIAVGINGVPIEEVARRMGTNRNALYKLMHDGRLRLKKRLAHEGLTVEDVYAIFENK